MMNYRACEDTRDERVVNIEEGIEHSRCIICLSDAQYENDDSRYADELPENGDVETGDAEKGNTPLMDIRVLCGGRSFEDRICNCQYNIHTSCFVESNKAFNNVCPMCRKNWWRKESDEFCNTNTNINTLGRNSNDDNENESVITCYIVLNKFFYCCIPSVIPIVIIWFIYVLVYLC